MLGTQCILGTPREPFSQIVAKDIVYENIYCANIDWEDGKKNIQFFIIFVFGWITIAYVPLQDQNLVVRLKDFQKVSGLILNKSPKVFHYPRENTQPIQPQVHHVRKASTC